MIQYLIWIISNDSFCESFASGHHQRVKIDLYVSLNCEIVIKKRYKPYKSLKKRVSLTFQPIY